MFDVQILYCDSPRAWWQYLQDSGSLQMEVLVKIPDSIMYYLVAILFAVGWIIADIINIQRSFFAISDTYSHWKLLLTSQKVALLIQIGLHLYFRAVIVMKLYFGYCILVDGISNLSMSNIFDYYKLYSFPVEVTSEGDGQSISGLMPGVEDKDSLTLHSSSNPNGPDHTLSPRDYAIDNCDGHHWVQGPPVSQAELNNGTAPKCDFNQTKIGDQFHRHQAVNPAIGHYTHYVCTSCPARGCPFCAIR